MESKQKFVAFSKLMEEVQVCERCARMKGRTRVLSQYNGSLDAKVFFIAEAPGRFGADMSSIPLYGDKTGENFEKLLGTVGWSRNEVFSTNACLCNPRSKEGNNDKPTLVEIRSCSVFLRKTIEIVQPMVVVALGEKALDALAIVEEHSCKPLKMHVGESFRWFGRLLVPLYHPSPQVCNTGRRSLDVQKDDFRSLRKIVSNS